MRRVRGGWNALVVLLALTMMLGCQGLSAGKSSNQQSSGTSGQLSMTPTSIGFGKVEVGKKQTQPTTLSNTGGASVTITQAKATGTGFSISGLTLPITLTAGQTQPFNVTFAPQSAGSSSGKVEVTSNAENSTLDLAVSGSGVMPGTVAANPASLDFSSVQVGNNQAQWETLTNSGGSNLTISQAKVTGTAFSMSGLSLPLSLTPGQHFTFSVTFAPPSAGSYSENISIISDASNPTLTVPLSGSGTATQAGQLTVSPTNLDFGNVTVGSNGVLSGTLTANGSSVTVSSGMIDNPEFVLSGISFPVTIPAGQKASFTVTFTPQATGAASGSLTFQSDAANSPTVETLTGTGDPPPQHSVDLSWTASDSQDVTGYNVYRGAKSGGPYTKINSSLDSSTAYTDNSVVAGQTYYYVTTAVNSSNQESTYSNQAKAVIPKP